MQTIRSDIIYKDLSYKINGVLFKVRKELGIYKNEKQYSDAIEREFKNENIVYEREKIVGVSFQGEIRGRNIVDFLVENKIVLEIKAKPFITKEDYYQIRRYLDALRKKLGIVVNMRRYVINSKRVLNAGVDE